MKTQTIISAAFFMATAFSSALLADSFPQKVVLNTTVADLRQKLFNEAHPSLEEERVTQVLYGEQMVALKEEGGFYYVQAIEQPRQTEKSWGYCQGWIAAVHVSPTPDDLSCTAVTNALAYLYPSLSTSMTPLLPGSHLIADSLHLGWWHIRQPSGGSAYMEETQVSPFAELQSLNSEQIRQRLCQAAASFEGCPYLVGGRSFAIDYWYGQSLGVDAPGFVNLVHRMVGITIPRDAQDQYAKCRRISANPKSGDLVFLCHPKTGKTHVMLVVSDKENLLIESSSSSGNVRIVSSIARLGNPLSKIESGQSFDESGYQIFFGSFVR